MKKFVMYLTFLCCSTLAFTGLDYVSIQIHAYDPDDFYDKECADRLFDKYVKDAEPEFDKYLDKAENIPLPDSENEIDSYLDSLDPLAEEYINNLDPYAEDYVENLDDCLK